MRRGAPLLAVLLFASAAAPGQEAPAPKSIDAQVLGMEGAAYPKGARVAAARVTGDGPFDPDAILGGGGVPCDDLGKASVPPPAGEGRVLLAAVAPGYAPSLAWEGRDGEPARLSLRRAAPLEVLVRSAPSRDLIAAEEDPKPVAGALVEVRPAKGYEGPRDPRAVRRARTGADGRARFADVGEGPFYEADVRAPGFAAGRATDVIPGGVLVRVGLVPAARIAGRVVRVPGGGPVAGARVRGGGVESATGSDGWFALEDLPPGVVTVEAAKEGMVALDAPAVRAEGGKTAGVPDLRLAVLGRVRALVQGPDGKPVPGVAVRLLPSDTAPALPGSAASATSGPKGEVVLAPVAPGTGHRLVLEPAERLAPRVSDAFAVLPGEDADLGAFRLDAGGVLTGEVVGPDGAGVGGAALVLFDGGVDPLRVAADPAAGGPLRRAAAAGPDGKFRIDRVPAGSRALLALAPGRLASATTGLEVVAGREEKGIRIVLRAGESVSGVLRGPDGAPIRDALVVALAPVTGDEAGRARTGPGGAFRVDGLRAGSCALRVTLPGEAFPDPLRPTFPAVVPSEGLEVRLPASRSIEGVVLDPAGGPVKGQVAVFRLSEAPVSRDPPAPPKEVDRILLGADGAFATRPLPEGRWRLRAESPDGRVASADVEATADGAPRVTLTLAQGATVRGRVATGPAVKDLRGLSIRLLLGGRAEASVPPAQTEASGVFTLPGVPPGEHDLVVSLPGLAPVVLRHLVVPPEGGVVDVGDVLLGRGTSLRIRVYAETRAPLPDTAVLLSDPAGHRREEKTNAAGLALFGGLAEGVHGIEVRTPAGAVLRRPVSVPEEGEIEEVLDLGLDPPGTVEVRREGAPVPGAVVRVLDALRGSGPYAGSVEVAADDRGQARLPGLPEGPVLLEVTPPGEPPVRLTLTVRNRRLEVALPADGLEGEVTAAADGAAVGGAVVRAWPDGPATRADARGRFRFPSLPPGTWTLEVSARGFGTARSAGWIVLRGGGARPVRIQLEAAARLSGRVLDPAGRPVPGAVVEATDPRSGDLLPGGRRSADSAGAFRFDGLAPGTFVLTARAGGLGASPPEVLNLAPAEERAVDLGLVAGGTLEVRVFGPGGRPVADAEVEVRDVLGTLVPSPEVPEDAKGTEGRTGTDGVLRVPGLRAGVYKVRARKDGLEAEVHVRMDPRGGARAAVTLVPEKQGD